MNHIPPKRIYPTGEQLIANPEYYKNKQLTYKGEKMYFDQDIRSGKCMICKKTKDSGEIKRTQLHHVWYNDDDPLEATIEVCGSCHYKIDPEHRVAINMTLGINPNVHLISKKQLIKNLKSQDPTSGKKHQKTEAQKKYPNAYEMWKESDDEFLKNFWSDTSNQQSENQSIKELMKKFGRTRNGIGQRLMKLGFQLDGKFVKYKKEKTR